MKYIKDLLLKVKDYERNPAFQKHLIIIKNEKLEQRDLVFLSDIYFNLKDIYNRNIIIRILEKHISRNLKEFFYKAFKKEKELPMKIIAMRGYCIYAKETEVELLMKGFVSKLKKLPSVSPYCYTVYEPIISEYGLPYLLKKYKYSIFENAYNIAFKQYTEMPDTFKGIFTVNAEGDIVPLVSKEVVKKRFDDFFGNYF